MLPPQIWLAYTPKWLDSTPEDMARVWERLPRDTQRRVGYHLRQLEGTRPWGLYSIRTKNWEVGLHTRFLQN